MMDTSFLVETGLETLICPDKHQWSGCGPTEVSLCHGVYLAVLSQFCGAVFTLVWCDPYVVDWSSETRSQLIAVDWLSETKWQLIGLQKPNRSWLDFRNQIAVGWTSETKSHICTVCLTPTPPITPSTLKYHPALLHSLCSELFPAGCCRALQICTIITIVIEPCLHCAVINRTVLCL